MTTATTFFYMPNFRIFRFVMSGLLFFIMLGKICAQENQVKDGFTKYTYPSGRLSSEGFIKNGKPDGYWKTYYESGVLKSEGNRKDAQLDSLWKFYNEEGKLTLTYEYKEGKKQGMKTVYDVETGHIVSEEPFVADTRQGKAYYRKNNVRYKEVPFDKGKENGTGKEYLPDGLIQTITTYKNGFISREEKINRRDKLNLKQGIWKEFYPNGTVKKEMRYRDDKLDGYLKIFEPDGNLAKAEKYVDGVLQVNVAELVKLDVKTTYYESGKKKTSGTYKDGLAEGFTRKFSEEGEIIGSELFKDGYKIGEGIYDARGYKQGKWKEFYITGELKAEGEYINDKKIGEWIYYHQNGKIEQRGKYDKNNKPTGDWKWYYESGNILRTESFIRGLPEGVMVEYTDSSEVVTKGLFIEGEKEGPWISNDGDMKYEGEFKAGVKTGKWKSYYNGNGKIAEEGTYIDGLENGKFTYYYYNGKTKEEGEYLMGNKEGNWRKFDTEGTLYSTIVYKDNKEYKIDGTKVKEEENPIEEK